MSAADLAWAIVIGAGVVGFGCALHELWTAWGATSQSEDWHP